MPDVEVELLGGIAGAPWTQTEVVTDPETGMRTYRLGVRASDHREIELMADVADGLEDFVRFTIPPIDGSSIAGVRQLLRQVFEVVQLVNSEDGWLGLFGPSRAGALVCDLTGPIPDFMMEPVNWPGEFQGVNRLWRDPDEPPFGIRDSEVLVRRDEFQRSIDLALYALKSDASRRIAWLRAQLWELESASASAIVISPDGPEVAIWRSSSLLRRFRVNPATADKLRQLAQGERLHLSRSVASRMRSEVPELKGVLVASSNEHDPVIENHSYYSAATAPGETAAWLAPGRAARPMQQPGFSIGGPQPFGISRLARLAAVIARNNFATPGCLPGNRVQATVERSPAAEAAMSSEDERLVSRDSGDVLFPWPRFLRTRLAVMYMGGISAKTLRRLASEHGIQPRRAEDHPGIPVWARDDLDRLLAMFEDAK